jgi:putative ABC transport system permease protein
MGVPGGIYHVRASGLADRADRQYRVMARLRPGATLLQLQSQLGLLADRLHAEHPAVWSGDRDQPRHFTVLPEEEARLPGPMRSVFGSAFGLLLLATGVILLIACSNVACLFLARAHARRRELAIRLALGAGRRRLLAMLLAEALVPALVAGALGALLAARVCSAFGTVMLPIGFPLQFDFRLDYRVLAFTLGVSLLTSLLFGLLPALEGARPDLVSSLKADAGTGDSGGRKRPGHLGLRRLLVVGQVAASLAFVVGAALALRGLQQVTAADVGLDLESNALMSRDLPEDQFNTEEAQRYLRTIQERLRRRPEVADAQVSTSAELTFLTYVHKAPVEVEGFEPSKDESRVFSSNAVTPGYLEMMGVELQRGRTFDERDRSGAPLAAVVNEAFVERFWPGDSGLGRRFRVPSRVSETGSKATTHRSYEVVGVVADGRYNGLIDGGGPYFWTSLSQNPSHRVVLHVRGRATADEAVRALREEVELAPGEAANLLPMRYGDMAELELMLPRAISRVLGWGGVFGMVLAVFGIYGVVTFTVRLRRHEMAIRQAMGARPGQVVWTLVKEGLKLSLWGLVTGLLVALPVAAFLRSHLYGVSPLDPLVIGTCAAVLLFAALLASFVPASQLSKTDAMRILRGG